MTPFLIIHISNIPASRSYYELSNCTTFSSKVVRVPNTKFAKHRRNACRFCRMRVAVATLTMNNHRPVVILRPSFISLVRICSLVCISAFRLHAAGHLPAGCWSRSLRGELQRTGDVCGAIRRALRHQE